MLTFFILSISYYTNLMNKIIGESKGKKVGKMLHEKRAKCGHARRGFLKGNEL